MARPTKLDEVPAYLRAINILEPEGNLVAEVASEVDRLSRIYARHNRRRVLLFVTLSILALVAFLALGWGAGALIQRTHSKQANRLPPSSPTNTPGQKATTAPTPISYLSSDLFPDGDRPFRNATQEIQYLLKELGYDSQFADGIEGPLTTQVIEQFQRENNLPVTGASDNATLELLRVRVSKQRSFHK